MIKIKDLVHRYTIWENENKKSKKTVLDGISFDIPSGQFVAVLGANGSGKSTLAKHLNVLLLPDEGTVWIDGKDTKNKEKLWQIRTEVGMVFQNPDNQIIGTSVEEDVAFGPENHNMTSQEVRDRVSKSLDAVDLQSKRKASPSRLSGGQKQRVAIAGVLACTPKCLVLDEPTAMLDPKSRAEVMEVVHELNQKHGLTVILITHHMDEAVGADQIYLMKEGHVVKCGSPEEIFCETELLRELKLDVPQVTELAYRLSKKGILLKLPVLKEEDFIEQMKMLWDLADHERGI
ncbi:energy-coupling factor transporter ATPase [Sporofaciens musculi]|uniref:energy-coupling factor transporter ATPase n=1 Tax=Sporofaciens musculi TaxID=2681861 RepID=UPI0025A29245|nr:energy-coupling factor transporter ATPase [Sporofaciens musculi]